MTSPNGGNWNKLDWIKPDGTSPPPPVSPAPASSRQGKALVFPYKPKVVVMIVGALFFGLGGLVMMNKAQTNDRGLVINGIIHLDAEGATIFYWVLEAITFAFVAIAVFFALPQFFMHRQVVIDDASVTVPGWGLSRKHYRIELRDIHRISIRSHKQMRFVKIHHLGGAHSINSTMLPNHSDAERICEILQERLQLLEDPALVCPKCGYSLRGNVSATCPECGTNFA